MNKIQSNMDKGMFFCGVFIDLQKAFDTVNHSILLHKLSQYGIRGIANDWFSSYLSNRIQTTQVGPHVSRSTLCGVPQGSVLGPLVFLVYVNYIYMTVIYMASDKVTFYLLLMTLTFYMPIKNQNPSKPSSTVNYLRLSTG